jgi:hypothetical protein
MFCQMCETEHAPDLRACPDCRAVLITQDNDKLRRDLDRVLWMGDQISKWLKAGLISEAQALELSAPFARQQGHLRAALNVFTDPGVQAEDVRLPDDQRLQEGGDSPDRVAFPASMEPANGTGVPSPEVPDAAPRAAPTPPPSALETLSQVTTSASGGSLEMLDLPPSAPDPVAEIVERESPWRRHFRPFLYENVGWFVGAFLLIAGSVHLVGDSQGTRRALLMLVLLSAYAAGFFLAGRHLVKRGQVLAGRVVSSIATGIAPIAALCSHSLNPASPVAWVIASGAAVVGLGLVLRGGAGVIGDRLKQPFALAGAAVLALLSLVPACTTLHSLLALEILGLSILFAASPLLARSCDRRGEAAHFGLGLLWLFSVLGAAAHTRGVALGAELSFEHYGPLACLLVATLLRGIRAFQGPRPSPTGIEILAYALLVPALSASLASRQSAALSSMICAALLADGARRYRAQVFTWASLVASFLAFNTAGKLVPREVVSAVKGFFGYGERPALPLNFHCVSELLFVATIGLLFLRARERRSEHVAGPAARFAFFLSIMVLAGSQLGTDLRPALAASALLAAGSLAFSRWIGSRALAVLFSVSFLVAAVDGALLLHLTLPYAQAGLAVGAMALLTLARLARAAPRWSAISTASRTAGAVSVCVAAGLIWVSGNSAAAAAAAAITSVALLACAFEFGAMPFAIGGFAVAATAGLLGAFNLVGSEGLPWTAAAIGWLYLLLSGSRSRDVTGHGGRLLRGPLAMVGGALAILALALGASPSNPADSACFTLLFSLSSLYLARRFAFSPLLFAAGISGLGAMVLAFPDAPLGPLAGGLATLLALAGAAARAWPSAAELLLADSGRRIAKVLAATALALCGLALAGALFNTRTEEAGAFALIALSLALSARVFAFAPLVLGTAVSAIAAAACAGSESASATTTGFSAAVAMILAVGLQRLPLLSRLLFGMPVDRAEEARTALLSAGLLAATFSMVASFFLSPPGPLSTVWLPLAMGGITCLLAYFASGAPLFLAPSAAALVLAAAFSRSTLLHGAVAGLLAVNVVFLLSGLLGTARGIRWLERLVDGLTHPDHRRGISPGAAEILGACGAVGTLMGLAVVLGFGALAGLYRLELSTIPISAGLPLLLATFGVTAAHQLRRRPGAAAWHVALLLALPAMPILLPSELWATSMGAWSVLLALCEGAIRRSGRAGESPRGLVGALGAHATTHALLACVATGFDPQLVATPVALSLACLAFTLRAHAGSRFAKVLALTLLPVGAHFVLFHVGIRLSTGKPRVLILPFVSALSGGLALATDHISEWRRRARGECAGRSLRSAALIYAALALLEIAAGSVLNHGYQLPELAASVAAGVAIIVYAVRRASRTGAEGYAYLAHGALALVYLCLRTQTDLFGPAKQAGDADTLAAVVFGLLFHGLGAAANRVGVEALRRPSKVMAHVVPVLGLMLMGAKPTTEHAALLFGVALHFTALAARGGRVATVMAAVGYNLAIAMVWMQQGIGDPQFYAIPAGVSLIVLGQLFSSSIGEAWHGRLRTVAILLIYVSSSYRTLLFEDFTYLLACVALCVVGVAVGIAMRVRVYLYLGTAFLVTSVVANLARYGVRHHQAGALFLTALGMMVVGFMVFFTARREELLRKYQAAQAMLAEWQ